MFFPNRKKTVTLLSLLLLFLYSLVNQKKSMPSFPPFSSLNLHSEWQKGNIFLESRSILQQLTETNGVPSSSSENLRDIHIVMIGDTVMRYQYLSLAFRLRHGVWFHDSMWNFDLVNELSFENPFHDIVRNEFFFQTNNILQPLEVCDCLTGRRERDQVENRYFYDPVHNNSLVYLAAMGHKRPLKGRLLPDQVRNQDSSWRVDSLQTSKSIVWEHTWEDVISTYIPRLDPPPKQVVMNAGLCEHNFGKAAEPKNRSNPWSQETHNLLNAVSNLPGITAVWKTTAFGMHGQKSKFERDGIMCTLLPYCLNLSFTEHVRAELYWDQFHVKEPVHRVVNEQMLDLLGYLPTNYRRLDPSSVANDTSDETTSRQQVSDLKTYTPSVFLPKTLDSNPLLRDIHIVMVGDSLMRYQYLSLAFRLRHGVWFDETLWHYNLVHNRTFGNPFHGRIWSEFLFQSAPSVRTL